MLALRDRLETGLRAIAPETVIFGATAERLPNTTLFTVPGHEGGDRGHCLRPRRRRGVVGGGLLLGQGPALACPCGNGSFAAAHPRRGAR